MAWLFSNPDHTLGVERAKFLGYFKHDHFPAQHSHPCLDDPTVLDRTQAEVLRPVMLGSQSLEINTPRAFIVGKHRYPARAHRSII